MGSETSRTKAFVAVFQATVPAKNADAKSVPPGETCMCPEPAGNPPATSTRASEPGSMIARF